MAIWKRLKKYRSMDLDQETDKRMGGAKLEKNDLLALLISSFLTLWLPALLILLALCALVMLILGMF
jgi:hypothetical protein